MMNFVKVVNDGVDFVGEVIEEKEDKVRLVVRIGSVYNGVWVSKSEVEEVEVRDWKFNRSMEDVVKIIKSKVNGRKKSKVDMFLELFDEDESLVYNRKVAISVGVERGISTINGCSTFFNTAKKKYLGLE